MLRIAAFLLLAASLNGCGQRGPLYLPNHPDIAVTPEKPAPIPTASTVPASK